MKRTAAIATTAALVLCAAMLALPKGGGPAGATQSRPAWGEVRWPFPIDQWGLGKAYLCKAADCGVEVTLYLRAKIGFCNCSSGVADDEELDRISDFDLLGDQMTAIAPGQPITVAWMKGRSRAFLIGGRQPLGKSALSVGFNDRCDAIIATAVVANSRPAAVEPAVLEFLNSAVVLRWAAVTLGL
ncbi:MAG: hypothetical protein WDO17_08060 [Alphaproteobacteria bacterium]